MSNAGRSLRVLVVDDSVDSADSLALLLELDGHQVRTATDGLAALDVAVAFAPQAVLLDVGLPRLDGYEVARRLRCLDACRGSLLIALTGYGRPEDRAAALAAGFDEHLTKPADPTVIASVIANYHGRSPIG